ncbi:MAG: efflux RND transporter permease subunit, partial [Candidatus Muiribacteriaceae bacterium]
MILSEIAVKRPVTVFMVVIGVVLVGFLALNGLSIDLFPDIDFPVAFIQAVYPGVDPAEMENIVTKKLEDEISTVSDIDKMTSYSLEGFSQIVIEFNWGKDIDFGAMDLREKTDIAKRVLPADLESITVSKFDINSQPIMTVSVASDTIDLIALRTLVDDEIKPLMERVAGVAQAEVSGGREREIHILVDLDKLEQYSISTADIVSAISRGNSNMPSGDFEEGQFKYLVKVEGEVESLGEIGDITIAKKGEAVIRVKDVAEISDTFKDLSSFSRVNGNPSVTLTVKKETGANPVEISDGIKNRIENMKKDYPDITVVIGRDESDFIRDSIGMVKSNAMTGGILAIVVLFIFLKNPRSTLIIGISIPVSIIATFALLYMKEGVTLNLMTLGGLALGIG